MRKVVKIHSAEYRPIADLITYSPLPTASLPMLDPFLFLNHHGPQKYQPKNRGLPFGPHPHRGMETVTFILDGDIAHSDSDGNESVIESGGIQWMTAGSGLIHAEVSSEKFKKEGGDLEILQLWINLPAKDKMTKPKYLGFQKDKIPHFKINDSVSAELISGELDGKTGAFETIYPITLSVLRFKKGGEFSMEIPEEQAIFFYVIKGEMDVNNTCVKSLHLAEFNHSGKEVIMKGMEQSIVLFGYAKPLGEPVVARGPFVMNTQEEIEEAYQDYEAGKMGSWN